MYVVRPSHSGLVSVAMTYNHRSLGETNSEGAGELISASLNLQTTEKILDNNATNTN